MSLIEEYTKEITATNSNRSLGATILIILWVYGIVLAKGFWSVFFAIILPIYSWYLAVGSLAVHYGLGV